MIPSAIVTHEPGGVRRQTRMPKTLMKPLGDDTVLGSEARKQPNSALTLLYHRPRRSSADEVGFVQSAHIRRRRRKLAQILPSISRQPRGGTIGLCQRRKPPEAVAEGQRLQRPIVPPQSQGEIGCMAASGTHL